MRRFNHVRRYRSCQDGATAIEFAIISPILFLLVMGIVETGMIMSAQNSLESATYIASRTGRTRFIETGKTQEETIMETLEERASLFLNSSHATIDKMVVTTETYAAFDEIDAPEPWVDDNSNGQWDSGEAYTNGVEV